MEKFSGIQFRVKRVKSLIGDEKGTKGKGRVVMNLAILVDILLTYLVLVTARDWSQIMIMI